MQPYNTNTLTFSAFILSAGGLRWSWSTSDEFPEEVLNKCSLAITATHLYLQMSLKPGPEWPSTAEAKLDNLSLGITSAKNCPLTYNTRNRTLHLAAMKLTAPAVGHPSTASLRYNPISLFSFCNTAARIFGTQRLVSLCTFFVSTSYLYFVFYFVIFGIFI